jgi:lipoyl-dependent peroxiredoxin
MKRFATAIWFGSGKEGTGNVTTESSVLNKTKFSFKSLFTKSRDTNPEELIAAAHASCFSIKLSFVLGESGFVADRVETKAIISFENGTTISASHLVVKAKIPGINDAIFKACVKEAELNSPVSKVLNAKISVESELE